MTTRSRWLCCAGSLLLLLHGSSARAGDPLEQLDRILKVAADAPEFRPDLFASCQSPTTESADRTYVEQQWCRRCEESGLGWSADFRFFPDPDRGACTLQEVRMTVPDASMMDALGRRLTAAAGREPQPTPFVSADQEWSAEPVGTPNGWRVSGSRTWLYKDEGPIGPPHTLRFLLRRDRLVQLLEERSNSFEYWGVATEACREAGGDGCDAFATLNCRGVQPAAPETAFRRSLSRLARTNPEDPSLPAQLYWAQRLGECMAEAAGYPDDSYAASVNLDQRFPELAPVKAGFQPGGWKGEGIEFHSPFRARLLESHSNVRWGRQVFLDSLGEWDGYSKGCDSSGFAPVADAIRHAEDFLRRHPDTETSDKVRLVLAEAYETWWSISISGSETGDQFADDLPIALAGREKAKQEALALYRRLSARPGANLCLKDRIFRLERNMDTFARGWVCSKC